MLGFTRTPDAFDAEVSSLRAAAVPVDAFDIEGATLQNGVAHMGVAKGVA